MVCQLAKLAGLKVIGSTGSEDKVKYLLEEIGIDHAFNYNSISPSDALAKWGPIDIYWDNGMASASTSFSVLTRPL